LDEIVAFGLVDDRIAEAGDEQAAEPRLPQPGPADELYAVAPSWQANIDNGYVELVAVDQVERLGRGSGLFDPEFGIPEQSDDDIANPGVVIDHEDRRGTHKHPSLPRVPEERLTR